MAECLAIIWVVLAAIVMMMFGIWTIINAPAQWFAAILMLGGSGASFVLGGMLTKGFR